ncbi:DUF6542 domain-containing protein [Streptomyces physcomitrii]|uniref:DUF6542 domain-containing protein n=1 Tax=Streptomyces physcomitrii TaxID=2724184 RepID=UPI003F4D4F3A
MEQPRTRPPQSRQRRTAPLPPQGGPRRTGPAAVRRPQAPGAPAARTPRRPGPERGPRPGRDPRPGRGAGAGLAERIRQLPNPRLTGLGSGLFCAAAMFLVAGLDRLLFGSSLAVYGFFFLPVSALTALWVRNADLVLAPVVVPIAFAVGVFPVADTEGGIGGLLMGLFTALALHAGWLYGGTLVAGLIVSVRKIRLMARRAAARRGRPPQPPGGQGTRRPRPPAQGGPKGGPHGGPHAGRRPARPTRA